VMDRNKNLKLPTRNDSRIHPYGAPELHSIFPVLPSGFAVFFTSQHVLRQHVPSGSNLFNRGYMP